MAQQPGQNRLTSFATGSTGFNFGQAATSPQMNFQFGAQRAATATSPNSAPAPRPEAHGGDHEKSESRFSDMYKAKATSKELQRKRALERLQEQKEKRCDYLNHVRKLTDLFAEDEETMEQEQWLKEQQRYGESGPELAHTMDYIEDKKKKREDRKKETWRFKNQLMHSEWLLDKPDDFVEKWVMIPIPEGKRNFVVASGGQTAAYAKNGMLISTFSSNLPGGGRHKHKWNFETAILDCVYNDVTKTYYILDMMCWRQTPMYDTETQFRFYWMHEKFLEVPEVTKVVPKTNPYRFEPLPNFSCQEENITNVLSCSMSVPLDGLLFYHKEAHYTFGPTPLVLWLRPFMIPEALGISVPQKFIDRAPPDYKGFDKHRAQCIANLKHREELDRAKQQKAWDKKREKKGEKGKGKEVTPIDHTFVSGGSMQSTNLNPNETFMDT